mgnify:CR=1 FL=1
MPTIDILSPAGKKSGSVDLPAEIFDVQANVPLMHQVVVAQLAAARQGTHKVKTRSETSYSTKKIYRQKGTGGARHGSRKAPIFRKGGVYKGPVPRSHAFDLPKKVRQLGLKHALSAKAKAGELVVIEAAEGAAKTKELAKQVKDLGWKRALIIDGAEVNEGFARAAANIDGLDVLPSMGANVYDILKRDTLVITRAGVEALEARLK